MSLSSRYKTDKVKITEGAPVEMPPNDDGSIPTFYVSFASQNNPQYQAKITALSAPYKRLIDTNELPEEKARAIQREAFMSVSLKGFANVLLSDVTGNEADNGFADFNRQNAEQLFENIPELYNRVFAASFAYQTFMPKRLETEAKN